MLYTDVTIQPMLYIDVTIQPMIYTDVTLQPMLYRRWTHNQPRTRGVHGEMPRLH